MAPREQPDREQEDYRPDIVRPRVRRGREAGGGPTENADEWREDWHSTADTGNESERAAERTSGQVQHVSVHEIRQ